MFFAVSNLEARRATRISVKSNRCSEKHIEVSGSEIVSLDKR